MAEKPALSLFDRFRTQVEHRNLNDRALIEGPLVHLSDKELQADVKEFSKHLPDVSYQDVLRAARVAKDIRTYDQVARNAATQTNLLVTLEEHEKRGLVSEHDELRGQFRSIFPVVLTVGCAAFLQGHVQASINCASLYAQWLECSLAPGAGCSSTAPATADDDWRWQWKLGAANSSPFFAAAIVGAPTSLLLNFWVGRRGAITVAAVLILASSLGSAYVTSWQQLLCVRIVNGVGMGIKAVSTPILAGEIAFTQWRGSSTLMWQLWVAFGIAIGSAINLGIAAWNDATEDRASQSNQIKALREILGAPFIPAVLLLIALGWCMESPRYYMQPNTPHRNPSRAYDILLKARQTKASFRGFELDEYRPDASEAENAGMSHAKSGLTYASHSAMAVVYCSRQYALLFKETKLRNAVLSTCVVALAQQLCGNTFFVNSISNKLDAMGFSTGFGAVNFVFGLLAIRRIDTWGRRKLMLTTLPLMSLCLAAAAMLFINGGCSVAIAVNLFFAGVLTLVYPMLDPALKHWGGMALFSALNLVAFVLVFLLVEETKGFSLEDLSMVFAVPKHRFVTFQLGYVRYLCRKYLRGSKEDEPEFYTIALHHRHLNQPDAGVRGEDDSDVSDE
ncbi:hypothetical protein DHEL01_v211944 [Diaporthe helianthi]|uniref:Major facilitator superfamily (MFS) profile domain-containing protein n=1 Tax=Diaporthe helianthi TaxID=158607 RepID=A0A2P5HHD6_DIAHE|nr:hypothetical protein DHEL01_v211944 [Diaporthe helianthi]